MVDYSLSDVLKFLENKNVILVGNAAGILFKEKDIDSYDVVCRIDDAFPFKSRDMQAFTRITPVKRCYDSVNVEKALGTRTDILFLSPTGIDDWWFDIVVKPRFAVRTRKSMSQGMTPYIVEQSLYWCEDGWEEFGEKITFHPTTGCLSLHFLMQSNFSSLTLYGFDFYRTVNFWGLKCSPSHSMFKEEAWFNEQTQQRKNIRIIGD